MIDWSRVDTVLLDMDGTLLDLHFDNHFWQQALPAAYAARRGWSLAESQAHVFEQMRRVEGTLDWYCLDYWRRLLDLDIVAIKREIQHKIGYRPGTEAFLQGLRRRGKRTVLVTNAHHDSLNLKRQRVQLDPYLDAVHSSHDHGASKESHRFWDSFQRLESFDPARTVFVDDSLSVLRSAHGWGIEQVYGVARPDLQAPPLQPHEYPMLDDLSEAL
ncbi:putative hydrolase of the HAD superfamily [Natronocella acetinitrilica]|uniref:Hydrolase of the HAD superfamily n=1 Tax=Natronocella acetinitrilica TaxID=414046 RepID=A0AAE3KEG0_9GAMM|nr:GMP/IMP nucleotidase [Natronocella acetinitrilica]MCP1673042.1 putative hydrolase of the HAD superfamily [Natronocella acetinitrilica]